MYFCTKYIEGVSIGEYRCLDFRFIKPGGWVVSKICPLHMFTVSIHRLLKETVFEFQRPINIGLPCARLYVAAATSAFYYVLIGDAVPFEYQFLRAFILTRFGFNHWMELQIRRNASKFMNNEVRLRSIIVQGYLIFSTCWLNVANCFSILWHGK